MKVSTARPAMTPGRAAIIGLMQTYALPAYEFTMLEVQKLAYFLQITGEPLKLNFVKEKYGPYAEALHHVLQRIEGHFIRGYGDRSGRASLLLLPGATRQASEFLHDYPETLARLDRVSQLIEGFETPYGLELLATVHWVAQEDPEVKENAEAAVRGVHAWSKHKQLTFRSEHIQIAWSRLREQRWI